MSYGPALGYVSLTIAQVMIGVNVIIGKYLLDFIPVHMLMGLRFLVSAIGLSIAFKLSRGGWLSPYHPTGRLEKKDWILMALQGLCGGFLFNFFFIWGLDYTTATSAGIIGSSLPEIIALSAFFILKERMTLALGFAMLFAVAGILVISLDNTSAHGDGHSTGSYLGDFLIFVAMFPEAWYSILGKLIANRVRTLAAAVVANWFTVLLFAPLAWPQVMTYTWSVMTPFFCFLIIVGGLGSLLFFWLWPWGLKYVSATKASLFGGLMPVSTCLLAVVCLDEKFYVIEAVGISLVLLSLWMGSKSGHQALAKIYPRKGKEV